MFSLACNLTKTTSNLFPSKFHRKKVRANNADFSTTKITLKKVRGNNKHFSTSEITPKKVRGNDVDFSTIEITSKKYVETTRIFRSRNHIEKVRGDDMEIRRNLIFDVSM